MDLKARLWLSGKRRPTCTAEPGAPRIAEDKDRWIGTMLTELCGRWCVRCVSRSIVSADYGGASRTPVAEGGGALWRARRSISPREKSGEFGSVGSAPSSGRALERALQVAIVVVRERSHLERVGDRFGSRGFRLSQRNSPHMLGASPLMREAQHSAAV